MIIKTHGYKSSDGTVHGSLPEAQKAELVTLFRNGDPEKPNTPWDIEEIVDWVVINQEKVIDILTTGPRSKPRARKINGGTKTRAKKSTRHEAEQFKLPMEDTPTSLATEAEKLAAAR